jgi:hypothetical protein
MPKKTKKTKTGALTLEGAIAKKKEELSEYRDFEGKTAFTLATRWLRINRSSKVGRIRAPRMNITKLFVPSDEYESTMNSIVNVLLCSGNVLLYSKTEDHLKPRLHNDVAGTHYLLRKGADFSLLNICFHTQSMLIDDCDVDQEDIEQFNSLHPSNFQQIILLKKK